MIAEIDLQAAWRGMSDDAGGMFREEGWFGIVFLTIVFGLPALSLLAVLAKRWLAVVALAIAFFQIGVWAAYYGTDWIGPQSGPGMAWLMILISMLGWSVLFVALRPRGSATRLASPARRP